MSVTHKLFLDLPAPKKLVVMLWVFLVVVVGLLGLSYMTIENLSAARAYVGGEGLWSKAQKQAVHDLLRYSISHSERDFETYQKALLVPLGDRQARLELEKPVPNMSVVRRGLIQGRNNPEDVKGMAAMFRHFRRLNHMSEAIDIWSQADALIEQLQRLGEEPLPLRRVWLRDRRSGGDSEAAQNNEKEAVFLRLAGIYQADAGHRRHLRHAPDGEPTGGEFRRILQRERTTVFPPRSHDRQPAPEQ